MQSSFIEARTQNIPYFSIETTQHKIRKRHVRRLLMRVKVRVGVQAHKARINDGEGA